MGSRVLDERLRAFIWELRDVNMDTASDFLSARPQVRALLHSGDQGLNYSIESRLLLFQNFYIREIQSTLHKSKRQLHKQNGKRRKR